MISLTPSYGQYVRSGIEFVVNFRNGKIYLTDITYCELSGIPIKRVLDRLDEMQEGTYWLDIQICPTHRKEGGKKGVRLIPAETIFDWLLVDCRTIAERLARETDEFAAYSYRLAGSTIHLLESLRSTSEALEQQKKDIELLKELGKENVEKVKAQKTDNLRVQTLSLKVFEVTTAAYRLRLGENIGSEHSYGWLTVFDEAELSELIAEIERNYRLVESEPAACDRIEATIYEWHESAIAISSPELAAAFSDEIDEVLLTKPTAENVEKVKAQEIEILKNQEVANRLTDEHFSRLKTNKESYENSDNRLGNYLTVAQYLKTIRENDNLDDAIKIEIAAIDYCRNRDIKIELRETIALKLDMIEKLRTVYAFPVSVLKKLDKKRKIVTDDKSEHYFTIPQYFNLVPNRQKKISLSDAITLNALAFNICKEKGIEIKQEAFTTLGTMNAFPVSVIEQVEGYLNQ